MNKVEKKMLELLIRMKDSGCAVAVKAEFEAEGTRTDELLRLLDLTRRANLKFALKIGGCEAVRDLLEAKQFGVDYIIAPMVETPYALEKFILAKNKVFSKDELDNCKFLVNLETESGFKNKELMINSIGNDRINGFVFGRVDFVLSQKKKRDTVEDEKTLASILEVSKLCGENNYELVVGGSISSYSLENLKKIEKVFLSRFETRKIVFDSKSLYNKEIERSLLDAVHFELLWLINKKNYYKLITQEDDKRIEMLEARWNVLKNNNDVL